MSECIGRIFAQVTGIKDFLYLWTHHSPRKKFLMIIKAFNSAFRNQQSTIFRCPDYQRPVCSSALISEGFHSEPSLPCR
jgi:hypothetical protein